MKFERFPITLSLLFKICSGFQKASIVSRYQILNPIHGDSFGGRIARLYMSRLKQSGEADDHIKSVKGDEAIIIDDRRLPDENVLKDLFRQETDEEKVRGH
jgi:hypothetical protein